MPPITKNLLIINVLVFAASYVARQYGVDLNDLFGLHFFLASSFNPLQLVSYMFLHAGWEHIFFNMFAVWMFGRIMEQTFGPQRFLLYYMVCGIGAGLMQEMVQYVSYLSQGLDAYDHVNLNGILMETSDYLNRWTTVGASGAVYGILLAFGMTYPEERMFIFPLPVPIKAKFFVMGYAVIELLSALMRSTDGVAHFAHLGGMLFGFLLIKYWASHPYTGYGDYGKMKGEQFFDRMRSNWEARTHRSSNTGRRADRGFGHTTSGARQESDWDYNARKQREQDEIDRILDKIRKSGYDSLTKEEKQRLFDSSDKK